MGGMGVRRGRGADYPHLLPAHELPARPKIPAEPFLPISVTDG